MANKKAVLAKLKSLAKTHGPLFVLASEAPKLENTEMAAYKCLCGTQFKALANTQPFCVTCGSDEVEDVEDADESFELPSDDSEMSAIQCSSCGTHNLVTDAVAAAYSGQMHCVTCGEEIEYLSGDSLQNEDSPNAGDEMGTDDLLESEEIISADETEETETDTVNTESDVSDGDIEDDTTDSEDDDTEIQEDDSENEESATVKLIAVAKSGDLSFELSGDKLTAYVGLIPVATLQKDKSGEHAGVIHSHSFAQAVKHTAKQRGIEKALAHYNFDLLTVTLPVPAFVKQKAEASIEAERASIKEQAKTLRDDFRQSLQIASAGLNKSFFKNKTNIIKAALFDELSALNIRNPSKIIDKVFAAHSDTYHATLLALAEDMMAKPRDVRNQLAEAIGVSNYQAAAEDESENEMSDEETDVSVEETLESAGIRKIKRQPVTASTAIIADILSSNNGRLFSR